MSRKIQISRKKQIVGGGVVFQIYIDRKIIGTLDCGETITVNLDNNLHEICVCADYSDIGRVWSMVYPIYPGSTDKHLLVYGKSHLLSGEILIDVI